MIEEEEEIEFKWRMWTAAGLTAVGSIYYLVFLAYFSRGVPIEKIHTVMTEDWSDFWAEYVPLMSPVFLVVGLLFWYAHNYNQKKKKVVAGPPQEEYKFEFNRFDKSAQADHKPDADYVFKARQSTNTDTPE